MTSGSGRLAINWACLVHIDFIVTPFLIYLYYSFDNQSLKTLEDMCFSLWNFQKKKLD